MRLLVLLSGLGKLCGFIVASAKPRARGLSIRVTVEVCFEYY